MISDKEPLQHPEAATLLPDLEFLVDGFGAQQAGIS
jgi:hypothetical protein